MGGQIGREGGAPGADTYMSDDTPLLTFQMQVQRQSCSCTVCDVMLGEIQYILL